MARLRVRERLMPRVVMPEEGDIAFEKKRLGGGNADKWRVKDGLYPCELSEETEKLLVDAVDAAARTWGERSVEALEAEGVCRSRARRHRRRGGAGRRGVQRHRDRVQGGDGRGGSREHGGLPSSARSAHESPPRR